MLAVVAMFAERAQAQVAAARKLDASAAVLARIILADRRLARPANVSRGTLALPFVVAGRQVVSVLSVVVVIVLHVIHLWFAAVSEELNDSVIPTIIVGGSGRCRCLPLGLLQFDAASTVAARIRQTRQRAAFRYAEAVHRVTGQGMRERDIERE